MQKRNVTLSMPTDLIRRAKALAAARDKSLSELLRESLEEKVSEASGYRQARDRQLKLLATGFDLGLRGKVAWARDSVHETSPPSKAEQGGYSPKTSRMGRGSAT